MDIPDLHPWDEPEGLDEDDVDDKDDHGNYGANDDYAVGGNTPRSFRKVLLKASMSHCLVSFLVQEIICKILYVLSAHGYVNKN